MRRSKSSLNGLATMGSKTFKNFKWNVSIFSFRIIVRFFEILLTTSNCPIERQRSENIIKFYQLHVYGPDSGKVFFGWLYVGNVKMRAFWNTFSFA